MSVAPKKPSARSSAGARMRLSTQKTRAPVGRGNAVAHVYNTLRADILSLRMAPGEDIDDAALAQRLGLSRTPIREALARLAGDGLVVQTPNRGVQVAQINLMELPRYAEALSLMHRAVMRTATLRCTSRDLERIEQAYAAFESAAAVCDPIELTLLNRAFHVAVAEASHNRYLAEGLARLLDEGMRMLSVPFVYDPEPGDSARVHIAKVVEEHRRMIELIRARDADAAEKLGAEHAELFRSRFVAYFEQNLLSGITVEGSAHSHLPDPG
jgi:DNA-binding GntR family transcriptional regulator